MTDKKHSYTDRKYEVVTYDPNWPKQFAVYKERLGGIFGDVRIEHIGSTSVPSMVGKRCIDVLVIVGDLQVVEDHISIMEQVGFVYAGSFVMKDSLLFREMRDNVVIANIHFFPVGHPHIREMLELRDYLRSHPEEVEAYSNIKKELYVKYHNDYTSYRKYKDAYMGELIKRVSRENGDESAIISNSLV